jgi:hypothetical protein
MAPGDQRADPVDELAGARALPQPVDAAQPEERRERGLEQALAEVREVDADDLGHQRRGRGTSM